MPIKISLFILFLPILTACVTVGGEPPTLNDKASALNVQLGYGYMQQNNYEQANQKLLKAIRQNPDSASAHNAYAMLQDRLLEKDIAGKHYKIATELDPKDSLAANNYGTFLCLNGREAESEKYYLRALKNPLYETPEFAYTNAARCLLRINKKAKAKDYLRKALAVKSNFSNALIEMAVLERDAGNFKVSIDYVNRFHLSSRPTARSLWVAISSERGLNNNNNVDELGRQLEKNFPNSKEYKDWLKIK